MTKQEQIGNRVKMLLEDRNMSISELARRMDSDLASVSRWVNGKQNFTLKTIERMEKVLEREIIQVL